MLAALLLPSTCGPQVGSATGSSLQGQALTTGQIYTSQKRVLLNLGARDQHSPEYTKAIITPCLGKGPSPALQHQ